MAPPRKQPIDNSELLELIRIHQRRLRQAAGRRRRYIATSTRRCRPRGSRMDERLGELLLELATKLAMRPNFSGYSFDLVGDAMPVLLHAVEKFDVRRRNAHAYLTMCCWRSFLKTIAKGHRAGFGGGERLRPEILPLPMMALGNFAQGASDGRFGLDGW